MSEEFHATATTTSSSADQVFETVELLEIVLSNLPSLDLLLAQRVCRHWQATIARSLKLQRQLYYTPVACGPVDFVAEGDSPASIKFRIIPEDPGQVSDPYDLSIIEINQLMAHMFPGWMQSASKLTIEKFEGTLCDEISLTTLGIRQYVHFKHSSQAAFASVDASWRRMFLTQPPCKCVFLNAENDANEVEIMMEHGVTMGDLVTKVDELVGMGKDVEQYRFLPAQDGWTIDFCMAMGESDW